MTATCSRFRVSYVLSPFFFTFCLDMKPWEGCQLEYSTLQKSNLKHIIVRTSTFISITYFIILHLLWRSSLKKYIPDRVQNVILQQARRRWRNEDSERIIFVTTILSGGMTSSAESSHPFSAKAVASTFRSSSDSSRPIFAEISTSGSSSRLSLPQSPTISPPSSFLSLLPFPAQPHQSRLSLLPFVASYGTSHSHQQLESCPSLSSRTYSPTLYPSVESEALAATFHKEDLHQRYWMVLGCQWLLHMRRWRTSFFLPFSLIWVKSGLRLEWQDQVFYHLPRNTNNNHHRRRLRRLGIPWPRMLNNTRTIPNRDCYWKLGNRDYPILNNNVHWRIIQ